ncbi:MAG: bifunctional oligoribonuclease/PAP phosphatase NrnA [Lachnospiraceae bacterium]|nr:bifunctional oligoribonuclease/PAP phosphatase NrnA [Lachnospiraceae bacterium]
MDLLKECGGAKRIGISGHQRPDGDCVGACLAMRYYLKKNLPGAEVTVFLEQPPAIFEELSGFSEIVTDFPQQDAFDVFFILDCNRERTGEAEKYIAQAGKVINIDHHISNQDGEGDVNYVHPEVGSTCELIYDLVEKDKLDVELAKAIYIGMVHDTGVFQYSNTTPDTMQKAAHLISFGFDFYRMIQETFYQKTYVQAQIMGRALMESVRFMDGKCIVSVIDRKAMDFYQVTTQDFEGIVNQLRNIKGISCAIFMYETGTLEYKVSLRTDESVDAAKVASYFGGGGHARAAGCNMKGTFHDCVNNLSAEIEREMMKNE